MLVTDIRLILSQNNGIPLPRPAEGMKFLPNNRPKSNKVRASLTKGHCLVMVQLLESLHLRTFHIFAVIKCKNVIRKALLHLNGL